MSLALLQYDIESSLKYRVVVPKDPVKLFDRYTLYTSELEL